MLIGHVEEVREFNAGFIEVYSFHIVLYFAIFLFVFVVQDQSFPLFPHLLFFWFFGIFVLVLL